MQWFAYVVMEEAAITYSEPSQQFECSNMKYRVQSEGELYNLLSNADCMHGEELGQSKEHEKINDLREREDGLEHGVPCCNEISTIAIVIMRQRMVPKLRHDIPRHQVKQVICSLCGTEQERNTFMYASMEGSSLQEFGRGVAEN
ncbi:uncharacterized protein LOC110266094 isoform X2 [Arachis ipaensis]|uniref:uncharacterized protein LOC110266094 isoform X2 n=1 Tax=Arachis ipaensis TaxID=130454 RepID=UPI000A2B94FE|nr:uncharacterized protein LOC110266094 isoform X2 [Arachis ipaensis]